MPSSKKTANGGGSIRKKTVMRNGKEYTFWEGRVTVGVDPMTGRQKQKSVSGKTQKEVAQKLRQLAVEVDTGTYHESTKITVGEWLDTWMEQYLSDVKPSTKDMYESVVRTHLKPAFENKKLETLAPMDIQRLYNSLQTCERPLTPKTIKNIHGILHKALQQAVELRYLRSNPSGPCKLPRVEKHEIQPLDEAATKEFLKAIQGHRYEDIYLVTLFTGMREGEVLGLSWRNVDLVLGSIVIAQQLQYKRGSGEYIIASPKNGKRRIITLAPFVRDILRQVKSRQDYWRQAAGDTWIDTGLVFTNELGEHLSPKSVYNHFKKVVAEIGLPSSRFHDLRHSYAVASLQAGDDIKTVQENLGHHTAAFTLDVYGHVTEKMKRDSADRMQKYIDILREK